MSIKRWLLPDGIDELLPPQAEAVERLRRQILDGFSAWGYELVAPPPIEYLDALLTGFGSDLDLQTFKVVDQVSGRLMGLRADVTSQTARIDAHVLQRQNVTRLCYAESVLHARANDRAESRCPLLIGAEIYGASSRAADAEILCLMSETLTLANLGEHHIELGHVDVFRQLVNQAELQPEIAQALFAALQSKSETDMKSVLINCELKAPLIECLLRLPTLNGDARKVLVEARNLFKTLPTLVSSAIAAALDEIQELLDWLSFLLPDQTVSLDLSELRGYGYHTGLVFAAYHQGFGRAIARGGRYDGIGSEFGAFGRGRAATGFDADLRTLAAAALTPAAKPAIAAPLSGDVGDEEQRKALRSAVQQLRTQGERVIWQLPAASNPQQQRVLVWRDGAWVVSEHG